MPNGDSVEARLDAMGLRLPEAQVIPAGMHLSYRRLVRHGDVVYVAGHGPTLGAGWGYRGKVGRDVTLDEGVQAARLTCLNMLGTIRRELGSLDHIGTWLKITGYVNAVEGFTDQAIVVNGCSDLLIELFGEERLAARTSVGVSDLPFGMPVEVDAVLTWTAA
jgi:enamine deaminase RidA (YjgF/YER057c/UK114 family)